jgi:hypothetical protein
LCLASTLRYLLSATSASMSCLRVRVGRRSDGMSGGGVASVQLENDRVLGRIRRGMRMDVVGESNAERRESLGGS